ncbi:hypothetical protein GQX73_g7800 [Xylaria multiplex]|uniref:Uncharacterized protein n=1 Tax=Xylaria multiplex TaxID=323545 RepID=A0A7C8N153_9PEZI|nr:hypothetical protein GQX73_g7800 [Xylaria multiplex]
MKFNVAVCWFAWVSSVAARGGAGAYERLYYWFVYDMEVTVDGSGKHGSCNFNEFVNWISNGPAADSPSYPTSNFDPVSEDDINKAADSLTTAINNGDLDDVVPDAVNKNADGWFKLWARVAHATYAVKEEVKNRGDSVESVIGKQLTSSEFCLDSVEANRRLEHFQKMRAYFKNKYDDLLVVWRPKTRNGIEWSEVDVPGTYETNSSGSSGYTLQDLQKAIDDFNQGQADLEDKKHWDILMRGTTRCNASSGSHPSPVFRSWSYTDKREGIMNEELRKRCVAALRGEQLPADLNNLNSDVLRLCVIRGIRHHDGFGRELRNNGSLPSHMLAALLRALNARDIMSNRVPFMTHPDQFPYCIWYPQVASEDTYRRLAKQYPSMRYPVGRACAVAGYTGLFHELELLPDVSIADEARDNLASNGGASHAIYEAIISSPIRYAILNDYTRTVYTGDPSKRIVVGLNDNTAVLSSLKTGRLKFDDVPYYATSNGTLGYRYFNITEDWNVDEAGGEEEDALPTGGVMSGLLYLPLPNDLPPGNKNLLILMAAYHGHVDRYHRLQRPEMLRGEHDALVRGIYHNSMFAMYLSSPESRMGPTRSSSALRRAILARFIMNNDLSRITTDTPDGSDLPYQIWYPDLAHSATYEELAYRRPETMPAVARACIIADYQDVWDRLAWVPDEQLLAEARQSPNPHYLQALQQRNVEIGAVDSTGQEHSAVPPRPLIPVYGDLVRGKGSRRTPTHLRGEVSESEFNWGQGGAYDGIGIDAAAIELFVLPSLTPHENIYTIPNLLTFSRLVAAPFIGYAILHDAHTLALGLFAYAGVSDLLDGWIARRWKLQTVVGSVVDPMADKLLMTVLTVCLAMQGSLPIWLATIILGRDVGLGISAIYYRWISLPPPKTFTRYWDFSLPSAEVRPTTISKYNTFLQLGLMGATIVAPVVAVDVSSAMTALQYLVATTTVWSGLSYVFSKDAVRILSENKEQKSKDS